MSHPVMEAIYAQYFHEPRYRPSPITRGRLAAGLLGRKSGRGFYDYREGAAKPAEPPLPDGIAGPVWVSGRRPEAAAIVKDALGGAEVEDGAAPSADALILVTPLADDATTTALAESLDPERTVAVDTLRNFERRRTIMATPVTLPAFRDRAHALLAAGGVPVSVIHDSPGFVAPRILAGIVNVGCDIAQQRIGAPDDIDLAVTLGLGYPQGPLALGDAIGPARVLGILDAMHRFYGDPRYRASPWLRRRAMLGRSLLTPEA